MTPLPPPSLQARCREAGERLATSSVAYLVRRATERRERERAAAIIERLIEDADAIEQMRLEQAVREIRGE